MSDVVVTQEDRYAAALAWENACLADLYYKPFDAPDPNETPVGKIAIAFARHRIAQIERDAAIVRGWLPTDNELRLNCDQYLAVSKASELMENTIREQLK